MEPIDLNPEAAARAQQEVKHMLRVDSARRKARTRHKAAMDRAFPRHPFKGTYRGTVPGGWPEWLIDLLHDENEAVEEVTLPVYADPPMGELVWGHSMTCCPEPHMDEECPLWGFRADERTAVEQAVAEAQEVFDGALSARDIADVTGWPLPVVEDAVNRVKWRGRKGGRPRQD